MVRTCLACGHDYEQLFYSTGRIYDKAFPVSDRHIIHIADEWAFVHPPTQDVPLHAEAGNR